MGSISFSGLTKRLHGVPSSVLTAICVMCRGWPAQQNCWHSRHDPAPLWLRMISVLRLYVCLSVCLTVRLFLCLKWQNYIKQRAVYLVGLVIAVLFKHNITMDTTLVRRRTVLRAENVIYVLTSCYINWLNFICQWPVSHSCHSADKLLLLQEIYLQGSSVSSSAPLSYWKTTSLSYWLASSLNSRQRRHFYRVDRYIISVLLKALHLTVCSLLCRQGYLIHKAMAADSNLCI